MDNSQKSPASTFGSFSTSSKDEGNPFGSTGKVFGASSSKFGTAPTQNVFAQGSSTVFGSSPKPIAPAVATSTVALFGSGSGIGQSGFNSTQSSNPFLSTSAVTTVSKMFGSVPSSVPSSSAASLFGSKVTGNTRASSTTSTNVFGTVSSAPFSSASSMTQFGTGKSAALTSTAPAIAGPTLFGKPSTNHSTATSSYASSAQPVFGSFSQKAVAASSSGAGFGLFKGAISQANTSNAFSTSSGSGALFGSRTNTNISTTVVSSSTSSPLSSSTSQPNVLFGKSLPPAPSSTFAASSSSSSASFSTSSIIQAGKEKAPMLFGKPVTTIAPQSTQAIYAGPNPTSFSSSTSSKATTSQSVERSSGSSSLFGKPVGTFSGTKSKETGNNVDRNVDDEEFDNGNEDTSSPKKSLGRWKSSHKTATAMPLIRRRSLLATSRSTSDVLSDETAPSNVLIVRDIPPDFCEKETLREHFSLYGNIKLIRVQPEKCSASVTFDSKESALKAKEATKIDDAGPPMSIFYRQSPQNLTAKRTITKILKGEPRKKVSQDAEDELRSMAEIPEFETEPVSAKAPSPKPQRSSMARRPSPTPLPARRPSPPPRRPSPPPSHHSAISVPQDTTDAHAPPDLATIKNLLKTLYQARATETNERIAVLDKRDQLLKLLRGRQQSDLASAKAFKGSCPDMCPEKERYYREDTRRLALYEVIVSTMSNVAGQKTKVDHSSAVKEYSRSSADQVEPLSHELRPLPVLRSTMAYLLKYVADEGGDGKWSEWYDFLWNRTRGIRKDITQQQLCHVDVAHLLEQCARFHIFCSERLCEEDMMTFDAKINNENLTKCLQTLKELYSDLESKHNCYCPNEAEIRSYIVLMNLNQGDTLREVQQLRPEIRDSPYIRFAVRAYNALNSSNYVRFFRLIKDTTFLNGCILHRYFNQIRTKALRIIKRAMATQGKSVSYPVSEMIRLMCFENSSEVVDFCSHYGIRVENDAVVLDSSPLYEPEGSLFQCRSISLVESKRTVTVGETIYGGPLPELDFPRPFSSFDSEGRFIFSLEFQHALAAGGLQIPSQVGEVLARTSEPPSVLTIATASSLDGASTTPATATAGFSDTAAALGGQSLPLVRDVVQTPYSNDAIKSAARALILEETDSQAVSIIQEVMESERVRLACIDTVSKDILEVALKENIRAVVAGVIEEEEQELRHALEEASRKQQCMDKIRDEIIEDVLGVLVKDVTREEWRLIETERQRLATDRCAHSCTEAMLDLVVKEQIDDIAAEVFQVDVVAKRERLAATEATVQLGKMRQCFMRWHRFYVRSVRVRRAMLDFPVAPPTRSHFSQLSALVPSRPSSHIIGKSFYVGERAKLTVTSPMDTLYNNLHLSAKLSMASAQQMLSGLQMWQSMDIPSTVSRQLINLMQEWKDCSLVAKDTSYIQWKLVLSTPIQKSEDEMLFIRWLKTKLGWEMKEDGSDRTPVTTTEGDIINKYTTSLTIPQSRPLSLSFCVKSFHGNWKDTQATNAGRQEVLKGMNGLIFVTSDASTLLSTKEADWKKDRLRLQDMLMKKAKHPAVPLVIIVPRLSPDVSVSSDVLDDRFQLCSHHKKGLLSAVHFAQPCIAPELSGQDFGTEWITQLSNCIRFLVSRIPAPPSLAVKPLSDYVEDGVVEYYKATVYQDLRTRTRQQLLHQSPNTLLSLYNDVIDHLALVIASDTLTKASWPAPEFDQQSQGLKSHWNSQEHLCGIYELMTNMRLPLFRYSDMEEDCWDTACQDVWKYIETVTKRDSGSAKICLYQKVVDLLHTSKKRFDQFCWLASEYGDCEPTYVNMAWTDLIDACIHYKMVSLRTGHLHITKDEKDQKGDDEEPEEEEFEEIIVYYNQSELEDYETPSAWLEALRDTETVASQHIKETMVKKSGVKRVREEIDLQTDIESLKKRNRPEKAENETINTSIETTMKADPALKSISEMYLEALQSEKQASEQYEKVLASVLDSSVMDLSAANLSTPYYSSQAHSQKELFPHSTPNRKHTSVIKARPDLKRRKLSERLSGSWEKFASQEYFDKTAAGDSIDEDIDKNKHSSTFEWDQDNTMKKRLMDLKEEVERQKQLDTVYEMKLRRWMMADGNTSI